MVSMADRVATIEREGALRRVLTEVRATAAYEKAIEKGIAAALAAFPNSLPDRQLAVARAVALREFAALVGWDLSNSDEH